MQVHKFSLVTCVVALLVVIVSACGETSKATHTADTAQANAAGSEASGEATTPAPPPEPEVMTVSWDKGNALTANCGGGTLELTDPVRAIANNIADDSLMYDVKPFSDCSGIFHRFLDSLEVRCPDQSFPDPAQFRSSRGVGQWYQDQGKFVRINDPLNMGHLIKPGAVMFYASAQLDLNTAETAAFFKSGGIRHVGVITDVATDENGTVTGYTLFHGRTTGKLAASTNYHKRVYANRPNYPAYGNGSDQWIGVAPVIVDAVAIASEATDGEDSAQ